MKFKEFTKTTPAEWRPGDLFPGEWEPASWTCEDPIEADSAADALKIALETETPDLFMIDTSKPAESYPDEVVFEYRDEETDRMMEFRLKVEEVEPNVN